MAKVVIPSREELERYAEADPLIHPAEVLAMLRVLRAGEEIQSAILDGSLRRHGISSGKFTVLIILYQRKEDLAPSELARLAGVTRATISMMLARMKRDGLIRARRPTHRTAGRSISASPKRDWPSWRRSCPLIISGCPPSWAVSRKASRRS